MNYEEFLEHVKNNILKYFDDEDTEGWSVEITDVLKNNGVTLKALSIFKGEKDISPNIYLEPYYNSYRMGMPLDFLLSCIYQDYINIPAFGGRRQDYNFKDYESIKDSVTIRLINTKLNQKLLENCPNIPFLDFSIVFRIIVPDDSSGLASIIIDNNMYEKLDVDLDELYKTAFNNTKEQFPLHIEPLSDIISDAYENNINGIKDNDINGEIQMILQNLKVKMFVMTNQQKAFGATTILYENALKEFADKMNSNLYLLPSSLHEVMLVVEDDETEPTFLKDLVHSANTTAVGLIDVLSDNVYYYNRDTDDITICEEAA